LLKAGKSHLYLNHKVVIGDIQNLQQNDPLLLAFSFTSLPHYSPAKNQSFFQLILETWRQAAASVHCKK
jgi:hypothetical protein